MPPFSLCSIPSTSAVPFYSFYLTHALVGECFGGSSEDPRWGRGRDRIGLVTVVSHRGGGLHHRTAGLHRHDTHGLNHRIVGLHRHGTHGLNHHTAGLHRHDTGGFHC